jgi:hypothetical protein
MLKEGHFIAICDVSPLFQPFFSDFMDIFDRGCFNYFWLLFYSSKGRERPQQSAIAAFTAMDRFRSVESGRRQSIPK